jgi:hypothetical protein
MLAVLCGNNDELIRFFEALQRNPSELVTLIETAQDDATDARTVAEQAIADAAAVRAATPQWDEILAQAQMLIPPQRRMPQPDDAEWVLSGQIFGA